jgi:hypothetical protein
MDEYGSGDDNLAVHAGREDHGDRGAGVHSRQLEWGEAEASTKGLRERHRGLRPDGGLQRQDGACRYQHGG